MKKQLLYSVFAFLLMAFSVQGQLPGSKSYDFRDGSIITAGKADTTLFLSGGSYKLHGAQYGLNMKVGGEIKVVVKGSSSFKFLGSKYSGLKMTGSSSKGVDLGSQATKVTNDLVDTYDFVYGGIADTLRFKTVAGTGNDLYLPLITMIPPQKGGDTLLTAPVKNVIYFFDLRDGSIIPNSTSFNGNFTMIKGLFKAECGPSNAYKWNGSQHGAIFKTGNKVTLQVAGNCYIKVAGCQYSSGTISVSSTTGAFNLTSQAAKTAKCYDADGSTVNFLYVGTAGTVVLDFTNTVYVPAIEVDPVPYDVSLSVYAQKTGKIMLGTDTITVTSGATAADLATVSLTKGILLSATKTEASLAMGLGGATTLNPTFTGQIDSVKTVSGNLVIYWADKTSDPKTYTLKIYDNSYLHGITTYDFRDGSIIAAGKSTDGALMLSGGSYKLHGAQYGLNMKAGGLIKTVVPSSRTLKFLGSAYSSLNMTGTTSKAVSLGVQKTKVATDLVDTYDFVYAGSADTLSFALTTGTGGDLYLPSVSLVPAQLGAFYSTPIKNVQYSFDFRDGSIVPTTTAGNVTINKGLISLPVGPTAYGYNGTDHGSVFNNGQHMTLKVAGNTNIKIGGCQYSNGTITVSSTTGQFNKVTQASQTLQCYHQDGSSINFLYVGSAGTVTLSFTGTTYIPIIELVPVPYDVELVPWVQKAGQIVVNGVAVDLTAGANATANPAVAVGAGTVVSATPDLASIRINLGGKSLSSVTTTFSGAISAVTVVGDTLMVTYADVATKPNKYKIVVADNSKIVTAMAGQTYNYNFMDGSVLPQTSYSTLRYATFVAADGLLTMNSNTSTTTQQFGYHDSAHGAVMFPGNSMNFIVAGNATLTFNTCQYGVAKDAIFELSDASGKVFATAQAKDTVATCGSHSVSYTGPGGLITATLKSAGWPTAEIYIHGVAIENAAQIVKTVKTDVWDFGAKQLNATYYNNKLNEATINSWYTGITAGTSGKNLPNFTAGVLSWVGVTTSDRLRTSNNNLTRYDGQGTATINDTTLTGAIYVNSSATSSRYIGLTLSADDEVSIYAKSQNGIGKLNFVYVATPTAQTDVATLSSTGVLVSYVAKFAGSYHIFDSADKPFYFRVLRKDATYVTLSGSLNLTDAAGIPSDFTIILTNAAGKTWCDTITGSSYSLKVPAGYTYSLTLGGASGYIITNGASLAITGDATHEIAIKKVEMYTVTGSITGLTTAQLSKLALKYTPGIPKIYVPEPIVNASAGTYSVMLEPNCTYTISATGVNDYFIPTNTLSIGAAASTSIIAFAPKSVYSVTLDIPSLTADQLAKLTVKFTNLNEAGYAYSFTGNSAITLRNGTYTIACSGLDDYALQLGPTSNLTVNGAPTSKALAFKTVTNWSFDDATITAGTTKSYKGMFFIGNAYNEVAKGHLVMKDTATVKVPMSPGQKLVLTYYYSAKCVVVPGDTIITNSASTTSFESKEYVYGGVSAGFMTIRGIMGSTTYLTDVTAAKIIPYKATITVGAGKDYLSINEALAAARAMSRPNLERVNMMIDPGNYEEMLLVDVPNVSLTNASATPNIALANKGVDIDANAVRITSYYGHGYNYFSMGTDQRWSADALRVNKENGYTNYSNTGSGTTNNSYWNATVLVTAPGFQASNIIFENSYNQYISKKESEDVVQEWTSGGKGTRPTDKGNTAVQNKSFVERAAAISFAKSADKTVLDKCRVVGRQDSFYGAEGARIVTYKGSLMGGTDYIFGGMTLVSYKTDLALNTSEVSADVSYITAAQQNASRGFLMYECTVTSAKPGTETASTYLSKPGELGRPWQATTSEVVFYNTTIEATNHPDFSGKSMIAPEGWLSTLGGASDKCYEYGTIEKSGENNAAGRVSWAHMLATPTLTDGTAISTYNFTKGTDGWDPLTALIANSGLVKLPTLLNEISVSVYALNGRIYVSNVNGDTKVGVYNLSGNMIKSFRTQNDSNFEMKDGLWIVRVQSKDGNESVKVVVR